MPRRLTDADYRRAAKQAGIPYRLLIAVLGQEGGQDEDGSWNTGPKGARGPAQLMPGTARDLEKRYPGLNTSTSYGNLLGGAYYLAEQKRRFKSWELALAAYNAGPGAVEEYGDIPPYEETQNYVRNILKKAGVLGGKVAGAPPGGGQEVPSSPAAPSLPQLPSITPETVALQGVRDLVEGDWNPTRALQGLTEAQEASERAMRQGAMTPTYTSSEVSRGGPGTNLQMSGKGGVTYSGQKLTHDTDGLPGYPAVDIFGKPGTPFLAPESGRVIRHSGRGGTRGGYYGWSVYFKGDSGRTYYIQHLNRGRAPRGRVEAGQPLGTISPWEGGDPHAHVGIKEPRRKR